jgi:hypothetical protein
MLEILSLVACGWLLMYNPSENWKRPPAEWDQSMAFDTALDCENSITDQFVRAHRSISYPSNRQERRSGFRGKINANCDVFTQHQ